MRNSVWIALSAGALIIATGWPVSMAPPAAVAAPSAGSTLVVRETVSQQFGRFGHGRDLAYGIHDRRATRAKYELDAGPDAVAAFAATTPVRCRIGGLRADAVLGDDPRWKPGRRAARIMFDASGSDPARALTVRWHGGSVTVSLRAAGAAILATASPPEGRSEIEPPVDAAVSIGDATWFFGGSAEGIARVRRITVIGESRDLVRARAKFSGTSDPVAGDRSAPIVAISAPRPNSVVTAQPVAVTGTAADDREIVRVVWSIDGGAEADAAFAVDEPGSALDGQDATWSFLAPTATDAVHTIRVRVVDRAGNESSQSIPFVYWEKQGPALAVGPAKAYYARGGDVVAWTGGSSTGAVVESAWGEGVAAASGLGHTLVALADGTVRALGVNSSGQLGDGTTDGSTEPVDVQGLTGVVSVAAGSLHSMALRGDGTVWVWGQNEFGQLGDGTIDPANSYLAHPLPQQVPGLADVVAIRAGNASCFAILADGRLRVWGGGYLGRAAGTAPVLSPTVPDGDDAYVDVAPGGMHTLALRADGTVWAWGSRQYGGLGDGSTSGERLAPQQVPGITGAARVTASQFGSAVRLGDGTLLTWGFNNFGTDPNPLRTDHATPTPVAGLADIVTVVGGLRSQVILALDSNGTVFTWGSPQRIATTPAVVPLP